MKLALGTVQFVMDYGISNVSGAVSRQEVSRILALAQRNGIDTLDTAASYGTSEVVLGDANTEDWRIVTKLPAEQPIELDAEKWVLASVKESCCNLRQKKLYGVLLHRSSQLLGDDGPKIYRALQTLKSDGLISKIGVSVYEPQELEVLYERFEFDLVQAPFNLIDRRFRSSGWMSRLADNDVEIHVRSVFLQGLLLMNQKNRPKKFARWAQLWSELDEWLVQSKLTAIEACLRFALAESNVSRIIVGVQSEAQLEELLAYARRGGIQTPRHLSAHSEDLLNPGRWNSIK